MNENLESINVNSYLSTEVAQLIQSLDSNETIEAEDVWSDKQKLFLNVDKLNEKCICFLDQQQQSIDFLSSSKRFGFYLKRISDDLDSIDDAIRLDSLLDEIDCRRFIDGVLKNLRSDEPMNMELGALVLFSTIERILGDLYLALKLKENQTSESKSAKPPFLLRDLVDSATLKSSLNPSFINLLKLFFYSPKSLNLRNLAWHGFLLQSEHNKRALWFLVLLLVWLNQWTETNEIKLTNRKRIRLSTSRVLDLNQSIFSHLFDDSDLKENCMQLIAKCQLISEESTRNVWLHCFDIDERESEASLYEKTVLLLPKLEHLLRKMYSLIHSDGHEMRYHMAFTDTFYITLDDLFSKYQVDPNSNQPTLLPNRLLESLNLNFLNCVHDLFEYEDGARLRDRLSHGELEPFIPAYYYNQLLFISLRFVHFSFKLTSILNDEWSLFDRVDSNYLSNFHPIDIIILNLSELSIIIATRLKAIGKHGSTIEDQAHSWRMRLREMLPFRYVDKSEATNEELKLVRKLRTLIELNKKLAGVLEAYEVTLREADEAMKRRKWETIKCYQAESQEKFDDLFERNVCFYAFLIESHLIESKSLEILKDLNEKKLKKHVKLVENLISKSQDRKWLDCNQLIDGFLSLNLF